MSVEGRGTNGERVFRNQETRFMTRAFSACFLFLIVLFLLESSRDPFTVALLVVAAVLVIAVAERVLRQGIYADEMGVTVKGLLVNRRVSWSDIHRFELRGEDIGGGVVTRVDLRNGTTITARALNAGRGLLPSMTRRAQTQVDELNRLLDHHRGTRGG